MLGEDEGGSRTVGAGDYRYIKIWQDDPWIGVYDMAGLFQFVILPPIRQYGYWLQQAEF